MYSAAVTKFRARITSSAFMLRAPLLENMFWGFPTCPDTSVPAPGCTIIADYFGVGVWHLRFKKYIRSINFSPSGSIFFLDYENNFSSNIFSSISGQVDRSTSTMGVMCHSLLKGTTRH